MAADALMSTAVRLAAQVDALAALAAHVRLETEGLAADPAVRRLLGTIAADLLGTDGDDADGRPDSEHPDGEHRDGGHPDGRAATQDLSRSPAVGLARAALLQAIDLVDDPARSGGWTQPDPALLQSMGRQSASIPEAFRAAERELPGLGERLRAPGATFLDIGTGAGWLAISTARAYPQLRVVGLDIFPPALDLAKQNVAGEGLTDRIELREADATALDEPDAYDAVWLPLPFLGRDIVPVVLDAAIRSLRPGGWILAGAFGGVPDRLGRLLTDLRTVRCGGHPWATEELHSLLRGAGLADVREVPRTWAAPVRLHTGHR